MVKKCPSCEGTGTENLCRNASETIGYCQTECSVCNGIGSVPDSGDNYRTTLGPIVSIKSMIQECEEE